MSIEAVAARAAFRKDQRPLCFWVLSNQRDGSRRRNPLVFGQLPDASSFFDRIPLRGQVNGILFILSLGLPGQETSACEQAEKQTNIKTVAQMPSANEGHEHDD